LKSKTNGKKKGGGRRKGGGAGEICDNGSLALTRPRTNRDLFGGKWGATSSIGTAPEALKEKGKLSERLRHFCEGLYFAASGKQETLAGGKKKDKVMEGKRGK